MRRGKWRTGDETVRNNEMRGEKRNKVGGKGMRQAKRRGIQKRQKENRE